MTLIGIASVFVLGIGAQWLAWRFKLPSILLLLIFGFVAGPVTGLLEPTLLQGEWLFPFVALSVGIILFEGGLSLRLDELREVGQAVFNLVTVGVLVTWALAALAAYVLLDFNIYVAIIIGSILTVTGPTVIIPLLRHVRPHGRVGVVAKWEGITIDPIGAILAVLVLETILLLHEPVEGLSAPGPGVLSHAARHALEGLLLEAFIGLGVGITGAALIVLFLRRRMVPDFLQSPFALMIVVAAFAVADMLQEESGLVATTIMGIAIANQRYVAVRRIVEFKEDLRVLLIAFLFIVLSARLQLSDLQYVGPGSLLFLGVLMLIVRPVAVFLSGLGTRLNLREKLFLSWLAPRGIVAAAVASLFSFRMQEVFPEAAAALVPIVFLVIVGTVAIYGLTISPLARWLDLAQPDPQGILFIGAHAWARKMARALQAHDFQVMLVDSNGGNVARARDEGLEAQQANVLSEGVMDQLNLEGMGRMLALTPNDEVNSLSMLHFSEVFESAEVYQLATRDERKRDEEGELPQHLRGRPLFGSDVTYTSLTERFNAGATIEAFTMKEEGDYQHFEEHYGDRALLLFQIRSNGHLHVYTTEERRPTPQSGQILLALIDPPPPDEGVDVAAAEERAV